MITLPSSQLKKLPASENAIMSVFCLVFRFMWAPQHESEKINPNTGSHSEPAALWNMQIIHQINLKSLLERTLQLLLSSSSAQSHRRAPPSPRSKFIFTHYAYGRTCVISVRRACVRACAWVRGCVRAYRQTDSELGLKRALLVARRGCRFIFWCCGWPPDEPTARLSLSSPGCAPHTAAHLSTFLLLKCRRWFAFLHQISRNVPRFGF